MARPHSNRFRCSGWWAAPLALALALPALPGCGDGLLGDDGIKSLVGLDGLNVPTAPAWCIRWILDEDYQDGPEHEVALESMFLDYAADEDTWYHYVNYIEVEQPVIASPPPGAIRDFGTWSFALGVPMLLDDAVGDGVWVAPDEQPEELWGVTPESALFYFSGDMDLAMQYLPVNFWGGPLEDEGIVEIHDGLQNVWVDPGPLSDWPWRAEWNDFGEWEQECHDLEMQHMACEEQFGPGAPECEELMMAMQECWEGLGEFPHQFVIHPDHPSVFTTFHDGTFRVETGQSVAGSGFEGGVRAFLTEAWWAWFPDPDPEDKQCASATRSSRPSTAATGRQCSPAAAPSAAGTRRPRRP